MATGNFRSVSFRFFPTRVKRQLTDGSDIQSFNETKTKQKQNKKKRKEPICNKQTIIMDNFSMAEHELLK